VRCFEKLIAINPLKTGEVKAFKEMVSLMENLTKKSGF
jgi:hypothetical protein